MILQEILRTLIYPCMQYIKGIDGRGKEHEMYG